MFDIKLQQIFVYDIDDDQVDKLTLTLTRVDVAPNTTDSTPLPPPPVLYKWWLPDKDAARVRKRRMAVSVKQNDQVPSGDRKRRHWEFVFQVRCL